MTLLFAVTLFVSAFLLFWVQSLIAKMFFPGLGGTPAVWNTCLLFFQGVLLAGYAYVLIITRWLSTRRQMFVHAALLLMAARGLPIRISEATLHDAPPTQANPVFWLLECLLGMVGLPFFVLSASAPLLQKWLSQTRGTSLSDPYFLYASSNAGSLAALVGFPLLLEANLTLPQQGRLWAGTYAALTALFLACAFTRWRSGLFDVKTKSDAVGGERDGLGGGERVEGVGVRSRLRWALLAFVPSSLVFGVTTYITTDVMTAPLLWVIPLALYLFTFVLAFARRRILSLPSMTRIMPGVAILLALTYLSGATEPVWLLALIHLLFLFIAAYVCHAQLVARAFNNLDHDPPSGRDASHWVVVARHVDDLRPLNEDPRWYPLDAREHKFVVWDDNFSSIASVFRWF